MYRGSDTHERVSPICATRKRMILCTPHVQPLAPATRHHHAQSQPHAKEGIFRDLFSCAVLTKDFLGKWGLSAPCAPKGKTIPEKYLLLSGLLVPNTVRTPGGFARYAIQRRCWRACVRVPCRDISHWQNRDHPRIHRGPV